MSDIELLAVIERYLNGEMNADERARFEMLRHDNAAVDHKVREHQLFTDKIKQYGERLQFENLLNEIHNEIDVQALKDEFVHHPSAIVRLWRNHHSKISVAASITIFAVLGTLFVTGYMRSLKQEDAYTNLKRDVEQIKRKQGALPGLKGTPPKPIAPNNFGGTGTGFAISSDGYIVTNFHVVNGADSIFVQNIDGDGYHAKIVSSDPMSDIAILKVTDSDFKLLGALPYGFKRGKSDLSERVFTLGYSKPNSDDPVYNEGYLSSTSGIRGDTVRYQLSSMDVNFGNSGGPLLDDKGNVVGIVSSKLEGSAYAVKSKYLYNAIKSDSLSNKLSLSSKNRMNGLDRSQQVAKLQNYVFMVKVYK